MATWYQERNPVRLWSETHWNVVVDPPGELRHIYSASTRALADVYMRGLKANNPQAFKHAYILKPARRYRDKRK